MLFLLIRVGTDIEKSVPEVPHMSLQIRMGQRNMDLNIIIHN